jgi:hypothetical protein
MITKSEEIKIPPSILLKLYDATGTVSGGNKGFMLVYVNQDGVPAIVSKAENSCVRLAIQKALEIYLDVENNSQQ